MSIRYEKLYLNDTEFTECARGMYRIILEIGKNEYNKKMNNAKRSGKSYFYFPSNVRPNKAIYCKIDGSNYINDDHFYTEGIIKINKMVKRGKKNKNAIRHLVNAKRECRKIVKDEYNTNNVFYIHRISTPYILGAIYRYIKNEICVATYNQPQNFLKKVLEIEHEFFGAFNIRGSEIVGKPYITELNKRNFPGRNRMLMWFDEYDSLIPGGINNA